MLLKFFSRPANMWGEARPSCRGCLADENFLALVDGLKPLQSKQGLGIEQD